MNCAQHVQIVAVAQCNECGRGLCQECADAYKPPICRSCAGDIATTQKADVRKQFMWSGALFIVGMMIGCNTSQSGPTPAPYPPFAMGLLLGYMFAGIPWGWSALTRITPRVFLFLPLGGWVLYFVYKLAAAATIGPFVTPFKVWSLIKQMREANKLAS